MGEREGERERGDADRGKEGDVGEAREKGERERERAREGRSEA